MRLLAQIVGGVVLTAWKYLTYDRKEREWEEFKKRNPDLFPTRFYPDGTPQP